MLHKALPGHTRQRQQQQQNKNNNTAMGDPSLRLPHAKIGLPNETFSFPFSAAPERFAIHAPTARADCAASTCATPHALATASHVNEVAARGTAKKDFLPARFRAGRLIRCPRRPQLSASFARCPVGESESQEGLSSRSFPRRAGHSSPHHARREREPEGLSPGSFPWTFTPVHAGHSSPHVRRVAPLTLFFPLHLPSDQKPVASAPCDAHVPCDFLCATSWPVSLAAVSVRGFTLPKVPHLPETHSCS